MSSLTECCGINISMLFALQSIALIFNCILVYICVTAPLILYAYYIHHCVIVIQAHGIMPLICLQKISINAKFLIIKLKIEFPKYVIYYFYNNCMHVSVFRDHFTILLTIMRVLFKRKQL